MRITSLARRSVAVLVAAGMLTTGGTAAGLLTSPAQATVHGITVIGSNPASANNTQTHNVEIVGDGFIASQNKVEFIPTFTAPQSGTIEATVPTQAPNTKKLATTVPLTMVAPGPYTIKVTDKATGETGQCVACFSVDSLGAANVTSSSYSGGDIFVNGSNFAKGARAQLLLPDGTPDPHFRMTVRTPTLLDTGSPSYKSSTSLSFEYTEDAGFTPGARQLRVINSDGKLGATAPFSLPFFTAGGVSPASRGAGATGQAVSVTGQGFVPGSTLSIESKDSDPDPLVTCKDVASGPTSFDAAAGRLTTFFSFVDSCGNGPQPGARDVTVQAPEGGRFVVNDAFTLTAPPEVDAPFRQVGQGFQANLLVTGSNIQQGATFSFGGNGVTAETVNVAANQESATIRVAVADNAVLGDRDITVTNPDAGSSTTGADVVAGAPLVVTAAPRIDVVNPGNLGRGVTNRLVEITGSDFHEGELRVAFSGDGISAGTATVDDSEPANTATFPVTVSSDASTGLRDIFLTNLDDGGTSVCTGCFGIDSLNVSPASDSNAAGNTPARVTLTGDGMGAGSKATLSIAGGNPAQPDIIGTALTGADKTFQTTFDLRHAAPGAYNVSVTTVGGSISCSACFLVSGEKPVLGSISPNNAGQGALGLPITLKGEKFSRGMEVTVEGLRVHGVTFVDATTLTALVDVPAGTAIGSKKVLVTNADGALKSNELAFTVNRGPVPTSISPAALGQGADPKTVTIKGTGFVTGSAPDLGPGIAISDVKVTDVQPTLTNANPEDTLTATVSVAPDAAPGRRTLTVSNPDAGVGSLADKFTVNPGPRVTAITPSGMRPGQEQEVTVVGTGFAADRSNAAAVKFPTITIADVEAVVTAVNDEGTSMTATFTSAGPCPGTPCAAAGPRPVTVVNPDDGRSTTGGVFAVTVPTVTNVVATPGDARATVSYTGNPNGDPITGYQVKVTKGTTVVKTVDTTLTKVVITGLANGTTYGFAVRAKSAEAPQYGEFSPVVSAKPRFATKLTSVRSVTTPVAYTTVVYSGKLTRASNGAALAGRTITVTFDPDFGATRTVNAVTSSTGAWKVSHRPIYNTSVAASFAGGAADAATATAYRQAVRTKVVRSAPASGASSSKLSVLTVTGTTSPNKAGRTVYLRTGTTVRATATVASNGTFAIKSKLPAGSYTLHVFIGGSSGNVSGRTTDFTHRRT